jgi:cell wall-associated NlpC family hydrolase
MPNISPGDTLRKADSAITRQKVFLVDSLLDFADNHLGINYCGGGKTPKGFDCSGFVHYVFKNFGYTTPPSSSAIRTVGKEIKKDSVQRGDIVYFTGRNSRSKTPGHVGIVTGVKDGVIHFIHSSSNIGISYANTDEEYYKARYMGVRRVID